MKLLLIPALLLAVPATAEVRFEADGVRVGSELVTGPAVSLQTSGTLPLLVSGTIVESLSGETLAVSLNGREAILGAGLRLARTADGFQLSTHGMAFGVEANGKTLAADRTASFKVTEKGFDFGALGALEGASFTARVTAASAPAATAEAQQETEVSPERPSRMAHLKRLRRVYPNGDPTMPGNAAGSVAIRQITRVTPEGAP